MSGRPRRFYTSCLLSRVHSLAVGDIWQPYPAVFLGAPFRALAKLPARCLLNYPRWCLLKFPVVPTTFPCQFVAVVPAKSPRGCLLFVLCPQKYSPNWCPLNFPKHTHEPCLKRNARDLSRHPVQDHVWGLPTQAEHTLVGTAHGGAC